MRKCLAILVILSLSIITSVSQPKAKVLFDYDSSYYSPYFISFDKVWVTQMNDNGRENIVEYTKSDNRWGGKKLINGNMAIGGWIDSVLYYYNSRMDLYPSNSEYPYFVLSNDELYATGGGDIIVVFADYNNIGIQPYLLLKERGKWTRPKPIKELSNSEEVFYSPFWKEDTLFFSKKLKNGEKYQIFYSVYSDSGNLFQEPVKMSSPYNQEESNNIFYSKQFGMEIFCSDRNGYMQTFVLNNRNNFQNNIDTKSSDKSDKDSVIFKRVSYTFKMILDTTIKDDRYIISLRGGDSYNVSITSKGYSIYNTTINLKNASRKEVKELLEALQYSRVYTQLGVYTKGTGKIEFLETVLPQYKGRIVEEIWRENKFTRKYLINDSDIDSAFSTCDYCIARFKKQKINDEPFIYAGIISGGFRIYRKVNDRYEIVYSKEGSGKWYIKES